MSTGAAAHSADDLPATSTWAPLHQSAFRNLWIASFASNVGTWMQTVGAQWLLIDQHAGPTLIALVQTASSLPVVLVTLPAGVVAEFLDRRRLLVGVQAFQTVVAAILSVLTVTGHTDAVVLLMFTFLLGCGGAAGLPAYQALVPDLVPRGQISQSATLSSLGVNLARAVGPALAGVLLTRLGVGGLFALNAASFVVFAVALLAAPAQPHRRGRPTGFLTSFVAGGRYVRNAPVVRRLLLWLVVFAVPGNVLWALLAPIANQRLVLGSTGYGILLAAAGAGAVIGALWLGPLRRWLAPSALLAIATGVYGGAMIVVGLSRNAVLTIIVLLPAGVAWIVVIAGLNSATQAFLPAWVRARALSIYQIVLFTSSAVGAALWGVVAQWVGLVTAFVLAGAVLMLAAAGGALRWPLITPLSADRRAISYWPDPPDITESSTGPVLVVVRYKVPEAHRAAFVRALPALRRSRLRTGATSWQIHRDTTGAEFVEHYEQVSWADHLEQHHERLTEADRTIQQRVTAETDSAPVVEHLLAVDLDSNEPPGGVSAVDSANP